MKRLEANAHGTIAAAPQRPSPVNALTVRRRSVTMTAARIVSPAKTARSATCVAGPASTSRCSTPAVDQTTAADTMISWPAR